MFLVNLTLSVPMFKGRHAITDYFFGFGFGIALCIVSRICSNSFCISTGKVAMY